MPRLTGYFNACPIALYTALSNDTVTVVQGDVVHVLDLAARLDSTAEFLCKTHWGDLSFPPPFGREAMPEVRSGLC